MDKGEQVMEEKKAEKIGWEVAALGVCIGVLIGLALGVSITATSKDTLNAEESASRSAWFQEKLDHALLMNNSARTAEDDSAYIEVIEAGKSNQMRTAPGVLRGIQQQAVNSFYDRLSNIR